MFDNQLGAVEKIDMKTGARTYEFPEPPIKTEMKTVQTTSKGKKTTAQIEVHTLTESANKQQHSDGTLHELPVLEERQDKTFFTLQDTQYEKMKREIESTNEKIDDLNTKFDTVLDALKNLPQKKR